MKQRTTFLACVLGVVACRPGPTRAGDASPGAGPDRAAEVRTVFAARCAGCHGPGLVKPRGRFGYVLDLRRLAGNPEMVVPSSPDESELWLLVRNDEMPPPDAPSGPLTAGEKEAVRAWIAAGAPAEESPPAEAVSRPTDPPGDPAADRPAPAPPLGRVLGWLGKFHLLVLHFPLALLAAAAVGELGAAWRRVRTPLAAVRFCLCLGAAAAIPTALLGWLYALDGNGASAPRLLSLHRWLGTMACLAAVAAAGFSERDSWRGVRSRGTRVLIVVAALFVGLTAHFGGLLAHGVGFFDL
jgi:hypothetical protein